MVVVLLFFFYSRVTKATLAIFHAFPHTMGDLSQVTFDATGRPLEVPSSSSISVLSSDPAVVFGSPEHNVGIYLSSFFFFCLSLPPPLPLSQLLQVLGVVSLVFFCVGIPVGGLVILACNRHKLKVGRPHPTAFPFSLLFSLISMGNAEPVCKKEVRPVIRRV